MVMEYQKGDRERIALAIMAILEAGLIVLEVRGTRIWFLFEPNKGNICVSALPDKWIITWDYCKEAPEASTYEDLVKILKKEKKEYEAKQ